MQFLFWGVAFLNVKFGKLYNYNYILESLAELFFQSKKNLITITSLNSKRN